jgi:hypothetical protein
MRFSLLGVGVCVFLFAGSALAQGLSIKSAELALEVGGDSFSKKTFTIGPPQAATPITGGMQINNGKIWEARVNFFTSNRVGSEVLYGYQYSGVSFSRTAPDAASFSVPLQVHTIAINLLYYPVGTIESKTRPFVEIGGGAMIYRPSSGGQTAAKDPLQGNFDTFFESSRATATAGAGFKRILTRTLGWRVDAGVNFTRVPTFGLPESSASASTTVLPVGGLVRTFRASTGIILYLGK